MGQVPGVPPRVWHRGRHPTLDHILVGLGAEGWVGKCFPLIPPLLQPKQPPHTLKGCVGGPPPHPPWSGTGSLSPFWGSGVTLLQVQGHTPPAPTFLGDIGVSHCPPDKPHTVRTPPWVGREPHRTHKRRPQIGYPPHGEVHPQPPISPPSPLMRNYMPHPRQLSPSSPREKHQDFGGPAPSRDPKNHFAKCLASSPRPGAQAQCRDPTLV